MPASGLGGPCDHCGRTSSCCWRRGPPTKPTLCNACGSRWLVKRSLDSYKPLATRTGTTPKKPKRAAPNLAANAGTRKPQGQAIKRLDSGAWVSEDDSDAYVTDDSAGPSSLMENGDRQGAKPTVLGSRRVFRINAESQLKALSAVSYKQLAGAMLAGSRRSKPRKPLNPTITAVF